MTPGLFLSIPGPAESALIPGALGTPTNASLAVQNGNISPARVGNNTSSVSADSGENSVVVTDDVVVDDSSAVVPPKQTQGPASSYRVSLPADRPRLSQQGQFFPKTGSSVASPTLAPVYSPQVFPVGIPGRHSSSAAGVPSGDNAPKKSYWCIPGCC